MSLITLPAAGKLSIKKIRKTYYDMEVEKKKQNNNLITHPDLNKFYMKMFKRIRENYSKIALPHDIVLPSLLLYLYKYENVCLCLFAFFSAIWNPIGISFATKLFLRPEKVLKQ